MIDLDVDDIMHLCTEASFDRGQRYFEEGRVHIRDASPSRITATVSGTNDYQVEIELGDEISGDCNCPYDWGGLCKHIVATLLAIIDEEDEEIETLIEKSKSEMERVGVLLKNANPDDLHSFLAQEMERRPDLRDRFMASFAEKGVGRSLSDYKNEVESLYDDAEYHGFVPYGEDIDFSPLSELAKLYARKCDFMEAAKIYRALAETIADKMDDVDDSYGSYGEEFSSSMEAFVDCIINAGLNAEGKRTYIKYLFDGYLREDPDYFDEDYRTGLVKLCTDEADLLYWKELIEPHISGEIPDSQDWRRHQVAKELIMMKLDLLSRLGQMDEFYRLIEKNYLADNSLCLRYAKQLLADGSQARAVEVAEECVVAFPGHDSSDILDFLSSIYIDNDPAKYREALQSLFLLKGDWQYYDRLKAASEPEEWRVRRDRIREHFSGERYGKSKVIEIYLREQMHDRALEEVLAMKSLSALSQYQMDLVSRFPEKYFNAYKELIVPFADKGMGRKHYQEVVSYLRRMNSIKGYEGAVQEIVNRMRSEHKRQPAFLDEMKDL